MIVRGPRKDRGFTILDNAAIRDGRLSFKARGIYAFVMSQREGYGISAEGLAKASKEGRDAIRTGLTELVDAGYLVRSRERKPDGTFATVNTLHETPVSGDPTSDNPSPVPPAGTDETPGQTDDGFSEGGEPVSNYQGPTTKNEKDCRAEPRREDVERLCSLLADSIAERGGRKVTVTDAWRKQARLLLDKDEVSLAEAERVLRWAIRDEFWSTNILSIPKFREKFDQLKLKSGVTPIRQARQISSRDEWAFG